ncbi:hypothetical protein FGO68_gene13324 [Halteria grandinella]|uniref:Uncharacterized protein n=1 Tax=Halteria grandinella TaxID=5974 RepID=A0A8J8SUR0_HALGN|nr:hypothetical protein FGO68_gene13324 [Halteria grandinella]
MTQLKSCDKYQADQIRNKDQYSNFLFQIQKCLLQTRINKHIKLVQVSNDLIQFIIILLGPFLTKQNQRSLNLSAFDSQVAKLETGTALLNLLILQNHIICINIYRRIPQKSSARKPPFSIVSSLYSPRVLRK